MPDGSSAVRTVPEICVNARKLYRTILYDLEEVVCCDLVMVDDRNGIQTTGVAGRLLAHSFSN